MRLLNLSFRGLTRFQGADPVNIDFDAMGEGLIALVGPNGSGKTTVAEAVPGGLFGRLPSRPGSLYDAAHGRDAFIELVFDDQGHELRVRALIDAERRTMERYLLQDGAPVTRGKAAEFDQEIEKKFGSLSLFLAGVFAAQTKAGSFLLAPKSERKALFVELLGLARLEELSLAARSRWSSQAMALNGQRNVLASIEERLAGMGDTAGDCMCASEAAGLCRFELEKAEEQAKAAAERAAQAKEAEATITGLRQAHETAARLLDDREAALAAARTALVTLERETKEKLEVSRRRDLQREAQQARDQYGQAIAHLAYQEGIYQKSLEGVLPLEEARDNLQAAAETLNQAKLGLIRLKTAQEAAEGAARSLALANFQHLGEQTTRNRQVKELQARRALLDRVPCMTEAPALGSRCPLLAEALAADQKIAALESEPLTSEEPYLQAQKAAEEATQNREKVTAEVGDVAAAVEKSTQDLEAAQADLTRVQAAAGFHELLEAIPRQRQAAEQQLNEAQQAIETERQRQDEDCRRIEAEAGVLQTALEAEIQTKTQALGEAIDAEAAALNALSAAQEKLQGAHQAAEEARQAAAAVTLARSALEEAERAVSAARERHLAHQREAEEAKTKRASIGETAREKADWELLTQALGRDGVQALEIDAAGPEVARLTNELLESCYGPRFSIAFETLREKKSARGEFSEVFDVKVLDAGQARPVEALSGGEKVIIGEAIGLALAIFNARKSGIAWKTLWRDETASALDPDNASRYLAMVRRARALGGFSQVIYVAHLPELHEAADARVVFDNGKVRAA